MYVCELSDNDLKRLKRLFNAWKIEHNASDNEFDLILNSKVSDLPSDLWRI